MAKITSTKISIIVAVIVFCVHLSDTNEYRRLIRSTTLIAESKSVPVTGRLLWVIKDVRNIATAGTDFYSPVFEMVVLGKKLHVLIVFQVQDNNVNLLVHNWRTSEFDVVRWKLLISFCNSTTGEAFATSKTFDFDKDVAIQTKRTQDYYNNHVLWRSFYNLDNFKKDIEIQRHLPILLEVFVINMESEVKPSIDYLKRPESDDFMLEDFGKLLLNDKQNCDTDIQVEQEIFCVHRAVLLVRAQAGFASYFVDENPKTSFTIAGLDKNTFREVLNFIYTNQDPNPLSINGWKNLILASRRFKLTQLESICLEEISREVTATEALDWLKFAKTHQLENLHDFVMDFVRRNSIFMGDNNWKSVLDGFAELTCSSNLTNIFLY